MSDLFLSRRGLLRNTALAALLAPVLRRRDARAAVSPRRVIFVFSPNGPMSACGPASGSEAEFELHEWWKPLERHKADGIFLSHMAATGSGVVSGGGHGLGGQMFSGWGAGFAGNQLPVVMFGQGQGTFRTGRYLRGKSGDVGNGGVEAGRDMARLLVAAVQYMGLTDVRSVGATGVNGPLASLLA